jgi:integration host factor subunit alpha
MALTKADMVNQLYINMGLNKAQAYQIIESLLEIIKHTLESGDDLLVSGFGKFCVKEKPARKGRNPATGQSALLPARRVVTFKCSGCLRKRVNRDSQRISRRLRRV